MTITTLQKLLDRAEITDLVSRLTRTLDTRDFEGLRDLFTADGTVMTPGGTSNGHDALVDQARRRHASDEGIQHIVTNLLIDHDDQVTEDGQAHEEETAAVRANLLVSFARTGPDDPAPFILGEVYEFRLRRTPAGWRLTALASTPIWTLNKPAA